MSRFKGKTALVTGATGGLGEEFARQLAKEGANLILSARSEDKLTTLAAHLIKDHKVNVAVFAADLGQPGEAQRLVDRISNKKLTVDILVNNAGFAVFSPYLEADPRAEEEMLQVNVSALCGLIRGLAPAMAKRGGGAILNVASTAAFFPGPLMAGYYASKAYVLSLSEALAEEFKPLGITVTALCPGPVKTGFQEAAKMEKSKLMKGAMLTAEETVSVGLDAMHRGKGLAVPGLMNKILVFLPRLLPRSAMAGIIKKAQAPE